jgi:hypothetical protein
MAEYLNFADLKATIIGLITGIVGFFICLAMQRYWSNRSIKSMRRRIEQNEAYRANVNNLVRSDRALLIYGFEGLFAVLALMSLVFLIEIIFAVIRAGMLDDLNMVLIFLWFGAGAACVSATLVLRDVNQYPESMEKIEKRITKLKNKLLGQ